MINKVIEKIFKWGYAFFNKKSILYIFTGILFLIFVSLTTYKYRSQYAQWQENDIPGHDIKLYKNLEIIDKKKTEAKIQIIKQTAPPIYVRDELVSRNVVSSIRTYFDTLTNFGKNDLNKQEKIHQIYRMNTNVPLSFIPYLLKYKTSIKRDLLELTGRVYKKGYLGKGSLSSVVPKQFKLVDSESEKKPLVNKEDFYTGFNLMTNHIIQKRSFSIYRLRILNTLMQVFLRPNIYFDAQKTADNIQENIKSLTPIMKKMRKGLIVAREGENLTKDKAYILNQLHSLQSHSLFNLISSIFLFYVVWFSLVFIFIKFFGSKIIKRRKYFFVLYFFSLFYFLVNYYLANFILIGNNSLPVFTVIPSVFLGLFLIIFFDFGFSVLISVCFLVLSVLLFSGSAEPYIFSFMISIATIVLSLWIKKRTKSFLLLFYLLGINLLFVTIYTLFFSTHFSLFLDALYMSSINVILSFIAGLGFITITESIFNIPTDYKLLELSDLNKDIFKELLLKAPGTYHHSILVANLAETAAYEIKANSLLVKVAAYYHDIGKIDYASYYTENDGFGNKMSQFTPSLSVSLVKAHLKRGVERARSLNLPEEVIELLAQHHGKSVIKLFYFKALQKADTEKEKVQKEDYMYESENPQTREAAILLLADSVEAASRSLKNPTLTSINNLLNNVIDAKFDEGVLDESDMTFKDVTKIKKTFSRVLMGAFHTRISYPEKSSIIEEEKRHSENDSNK